MITYIVASAVVVEAGSSDFYKLEQFTKTEQHYADYYYNGHWDENYIDRYHEQEN